MKCSGKELKLVGIEYNSETNKMSKKTLYCICSNDEKGKSLSIDNGTVQFTIAIEKLLDIFNGDYRRTNKNETN